MLIIVLTKLSAVNDIALRLGKGILFPEDLGSVPVEGIVEHDAQNAAGEDFTDADGQHHEGDRQLDFVGIAQYERHDHHVGNDGRQDGDEG